MELPEFEQIVKENQSDVDILTVNLLGAEQSKHAVAQFVKDRRFTFPIILDEHGEMMKKYQIITIPTTFLINEKGEVVKNHVGPLTKNKSKSGQIRRTNPLCERTNSVGSFLCSFAFHLNTLCSEEDGTIYINNDNYYQKEIIIIIN